MARAYQDAHAMDNLLADVKTLKAATYELQKTRGLHEEKITTLTKQNAELAKKNADLEARVKANEHNTLARLSNLHTSLSTTVATQHAVLKPLHDVGTGRPMRNFPKHERDIKTMGQAEVIQCLQALGIKTLGMGAAEKKQRLRQEVGLPRSDN